MKRNLIARVVSGGIIICICCAFFNSAAYAVPNLQVYIPGASYVDETWVIGSSNFELWVIAAKRDLYDVYLTMAVPQGQSGTITLSSLTPGFSGGAYSAFTYGTPASAYGSLAPHGIYPTFYAQHALGNIPLGSETVYDMVEGGHGAGSVVKFNVKVSGFSTSHYDAYGYYMNPNKPHYTFAPFSHDGTHIPEPTTLSLLGLGALGLLGLRKRGRENA